MLDNWHRLERVIKWTGLSVNSFALNIGLKRSENLYQIKKGNNRISRDLADLITAKYPTVSKGWLLSGEGGMFIDPGTANHEAAVAGKKGIPYYGIDAVVAAEQGVSREQPSYYINVHPFNDCDLAGLAFGDAMKPDIPAGSVVVLKKWDIRAVIPGESYLVITPYFKGIRVIRMSDDPAEFQLLPKNTQDYDPITINRSGITQLYLVRGIIIARNL